MVSLDKEVVDISCLALLRVYPPGVRFECFLEAVNYFLYFIGLLAASDEFLIMYFDIFWSLVWLEVSSRSFEWESMSAATDDFKLGTFTEAEGSSLPRRERDCCRRAWVHLVSGFEYLLVFLTVVLLPRRLF